MTEQKKYKRRQYIVDKGLQFRFVNILLLYMATFFLIVVAVIYFSGFRPLIIKLANVYPQAMLVAILNSVFLRLWIGFFLVAVVAVISAILVSHKIAGPLVRIKWALQQVIDGNYNFSIRLRRRDQLKDVAGQINRLAETLKKKDVGK
jgi:methyl-accepting chemotaxis protein